MRRIAPQGTAYRGEAVQLDLPHLEPGETVSVVAPDGIEVAIVLLTGALDIGDHRVARADVFTERASAVYLPPGSSVEMSTPTGAEIALAATVGGELRATPGV